MSCPGSIKLSERITGPPETTRYAEEGTRAHAALEVVLKNWPSRMAEEKLRRSHPKHMMDHVMRSARSIMALKHPSAEFRCETRVGLNYIPGMWGTIDSAIIQHFYKLHIIDYKHGAGMMVEPEQNSQLIFYALATAFEYHFDFLEVDITIVQPRIPHKRGPVRTWHTTMDALMPWEETFRKGIEATKLPNAKLRAGAHCRFCPASTICPELSRANFEQAQMDFMDHDFLDPVTNK